MESATAAMLSVLSSAGTLRAIDFLLRLSSSRIGNLHSALKNLLNSEDVEIHGSRQELDKAVAAIEEIETSDPDLESRQSKLISYLKHHYEELSTVEINASSSGYRRVSRSII